MDAGVSDMEVETSKTSVEEKKPEKVSRRRTAEYVWNRIPRDPYWALPKYFHIRTKLAERVKLEPNACQKLIIDAYLRQLKDGKPIRLIILKPRQTGSSTVCEALTYGRTATQRDIEGVLVAHDLDGAENLLVLVIAARRGMRKRLRSCPDIGWDASEPVINDADLIRKRETRKRQQLETARSKGLI